MRPKDKMRHKETLDLITRLKSSGIDRMALILRHSHRHFGQDSAKEPFLGLTKAGKAHAFELGTWLPASLRPCFFSSVFGRCIETAYLMDKGYAHAHGTALDHNVLAFPLAPFYVKDMPKSLELLSRLKTPAFLRAWFNNEIDESIMENPHQTTRIITDFLKERLTRLNTGEIAICISHDWSLFPLKEFKLNQPHETWGTIGFMEAVAVYEKNDRSFMAGCQGEPVQL